MAPSATSSFADPSHRRRIDYVFVGSPFKRTRPNIPRAAAVVLKEDGDLAPSDHCGVMADLDIHGTIET
jgi:endonuclease/exonuclease/phosphatase family metal-dependent hydrolase